MRTALKIINILTIVCALGLVPLVLREYLNLKSRSEISMQQILDSLNVEQERSAREEDLSLILNKNPFGLKGQKKKTLKEVEGAGNSLKGYRLLGTISDGSGEGYAVIEDPSGKQELYRVGQKIDNVGLLKGVWSGYIIAGEPPEKLTLVDISEIATRVTSGPRRPVLRSRKGPRKPFEDIGRFIRKRGTNEYVIDRQKVEEALENPEQLMTDARLQPAFRDGKQYGFVLRNVKPNGIYSKLGLRNGDILLKINEFDITDPETALRAFNELRGADEIVLHIKRGGREETLRYIIE